MKNNSKARREARQTEAKQRQGAYTALNIAQKVVRAVERRGESKRELDRLEKVAA